MFFLFQFTVNILMAMLLLFFGIYLYESKKSSPAKPTATLSDASVAGEKSSSSSTAVRKDRTQNLIAATLGQVADKIRRNMGTRWKIGVSDEKYGYPKKNMGTR